MKGVVKISIFVNIFEGVVLLEILCRAVSDDLVKHKPLDYLSVVRLEQLIRYQILKIILKKIQLQN